MGRPTTAVVEQWQQAGRGDERDQEDTGLLWLTLHRDQHLLTMSLLQ
jgi:hypothetical protein